MGFDSIDEFDMLLGRSIRHFQQLEKLVEIRLHQLVSASSSPTGDIADFIALAVSETSFRSKLKLLSAVLNKLPSREEYKANHKVSEKKNALDSEMLRAKAVVKRLTKLEEDRNRYVHSFWLPLSSQTASTEPVPVIRVKTKVDPNKSMTITLEEFPIQSFLSFLNETVEVQEELSQSTGRLLGLLNYDEDKYKLNLDF